MPPPPGDVSSVPRYPHPIRRWFRHTFRRLRGAANLQAILLWAAAFMTGIVAVFYTRLFNLFESFFRAWRDIHPWLLWGWTPLCFALAWYTVWRWAPAAGGSGIPQVLAANEADPKRHGSLIDRFLSLRVLAVKIASSLLCLAGGGAIGREGPTLQIGAIIHHTFGRWSRRYFTEVRQGVWIVAGASAGLAAAFNTPLGGIVFAIEELRLSSFHRFRTVLLSSIIVGGLVSQWLNGPYLYLGMPAIGAHGFTVLPLAILTGVVCGVAGALFGWILQVLTRRRLSGRGVKKGLSWALICGLSVALLGTLDPQANGSGTDLINRLLFHGAHADLGLAALRFSSTILTYLSGVAGGIFAPSLTIGATLGSWIGILFHGTSTNLMILLGMIAFLTGVTRTPFTAFVLVLEMTDRHSAIFPMMLAAVAADLAARFIQPRSFYENMKDYYLENPER